jgi:PAS domain S-box-containing protein
MALREVPRYLWLGLALILASCLIHLGLEGYRGAWLDPQLTRGPQLVAHAFEVISTAQSLDHALQDAERGQRGYLLTSDAAYLRLYRKGSAEAPMWLARLKRLTADNDLQQRRFPELEEKVAARLATMKRVLDVYDTRGPEAARQSIAAGKSLEVMTRTGELTGAIIATERDLVDQRLVATRGYLNEARTATIVGALLALAVMLLGITIVVRAFSNILAFERARHESDERLRHFVGAVTDYAIYVLDPEGRVSSWNAGAQRIKGYTAEEIIGQHFSRFYTEEARAAGTPAKALQTAATTGRYEEEGWRMRKDGSRFMASVVINPLRDRSGRLLGFTKVTRDITERQQHEAAIAQFQKMDALGQLTGGIAHDFNNLLHVMRNAAFIIDRQLAKADPEGRKYIDMLKRNVERASSLTQRLLAFSRRQVLDPKPIKPAHLIAEVTTLLQHALGESIAIETVIGAGTWGILADSSQLETALLNLGLNARDAMPGGGKITIEMSNAFLDDRYAQANAEVKPGQYVMIAVSDTGTGMSKEIAERAFDPFFTTKEVGRGTGLGLSQVYGFIKQSGGHAKIYSEPGEGTTVKLYLPRLYGEAAAEAAPADRHAPRAGTRETILVVEDEADVREFTTEQLTDLGYTVIVAEDAASALSALEREGPVDHMYTDVGLPGGVNGRELADTVREGWPGTRILFTTAYTQNAIIHHGRLDPGVELLTKPFTQIELADKVRRVLDLPTAELSPR